MASSIPHGAGGRRSQVLMLVPANTYRATDFLAAAHRMSLDVVVGSDGALPIGGRGVIHVDAADPVGSAGRLIDRAGLVDAVIAVDTPMLLLAAEFAAVRGLRHNSVASVRAALDKAQQRRLWAGSDVPQPPFRIIDAGMTRSDFTRATLDIGFPCVIKAVSLSGSQGILRADDPSAADTAAAEVRRIVAEAGRPDTDPLLVEGYVRGPEIAIEALLTGGVLSVVAVFDKPDAPDGPTFEETILITPPRLPRGATDAAVRVVQAATTALGLTEGPIHAELRLEPAGDGTSRPRMLELAARSIGGLCSRALRSLDGVSLEEMVLRNALGHDVDSARDERASGVLMLPIERAGVLTAVEGRADAAAVAGVTDVSITIPLGQRVRPLPDGNRYLGFVFAEGDTHGDVERALREARQRLRIAIV